MLRTRRRRTGPSSGSAGRHVGGKSITWGRQSYRLSDYDLKAASRDGFGVDWPLDYAELAPYYDRVERFIGDQRPGRGAAPASRRPVPAAHGA